jgi:hypothetical protein
MKSGDRLGAGALASEGINELRQTDESTDTNERIALFKALAEIADWGGDKDAAQRAMDRWRIVANRKGGPRRKADGKGAGVEVTEASSGKDGATQKAEKPGGAKAGVEQPGELPSTLPPVAATPEEKAAATRKRKQWKESTERLARDYGPDDPLTLNAQESLADSFAAEGDYAAALAEYEKLLVALIRAFGAGSPKVDAVRAKIEAVKLRMQDIGGKSGGSEPTASMTDDGTPTGSNPGSGGDSQTHNDSSSSKDSGSVPGGGTSDKSDGDRNPSAVAGAGATGNPASKDGAGSKGDTGSTDPTGSAGNSRAGETPGKSDGSSAEGNSPAPKGTTPNGKAAPTPVGGASKVEVEAESQRAAKEQLECNFDGALARRRANVKRCLEQPEPAPKLLEEARRELAALLRVMGKTEEAREIEREISRSRD